MTIAHILISMGDLMNGQFRRHHLMGWSLLWALVCEVVVGTFAMGEDAPGFRDTVRGIVSARAAIESYSVSIAADVDDPALPVVLTDGSTVTPTKKLVAYKLDVAVDTKGDRLLVARQDEFADLTTKAPITTDWHVFAMTTDGILLGRDRTAGLLKEAQFVDKPSYFDPLALGIGFEGEFKNGGTWRKVADNYLAWPENHFESAIENGIVRYTSRNHQVHIDSRRGYWPLRTKITWNSLGERTFETELELKQVSGQWLPQSAKIKLADGSKARLTFNWSSVNQSIASHFDVNAIQARYGLKIPQ